MHYTEQECREMLPKWQANVERHTRRLIDAIANEDWRALNGVAIELKWAGVNLRSIARDLMEANR